MNSNAVTAVTIIGLNEIDTIPGLCGNADGIIANDFKTSQGQNALLLPENKRFWKIGNSWRVRPPTVPGMVAPRRELARLTGNEQ